MNGPQNCNIINQKVEYLPSTVIKIAGTKITWYLPTLNLFFNLKKTIRKGASKPFNRL